MLNSFITLSPNYIDDHQKYLTLLGEKFGSFVEPLLSHIKGLTVSTLFVSVEKQYEFECKVENSSDYSIQKYAHLVSKELFKNKRDKKNESTGKKPEQIKPKPSTQPTQQYMYQVRNTLLLLSDKISKLHDILIAHQEQMLAIDSKSYYESISYLALLKSVVALNIGVMPCDNFEEQKNEYFTLCAKTLADFEINSLSEDQVGVGFCRDLRKQLTRAIIDYKMGFIIHERNQIPCTEPYLTPSELSTLFSANNQSAKDFSCPLQHIIFRESTTLCQINEDSFSLLKKELDLLIKNKDTQQHHFFFYINHELGPVELLSLRYNSVKNHLEIANISCGNDITQHFFLSRLVTYLQSIPNITYTLMASQAKLEFSQCTQFYALEFSKMLANTPLESLKKPLFLEKQPHTTFYGTPVPVLESVQWFNIAALGEQVLRLAPNVSYGMKLFSKIHGNKEGLKRWNESQQKLNKSGAKFKPNYHRSYMETKARLISLESDLVQQQEIENLTTAVSRLFLLNKSDVMITKTPKDATNERASWPLSKEEYSNKGIYDRPRVYQPMISLENKIAETTATNLKTNHSKNEEENSEVAAATLNNDNGKRKVRAFLK